MNLEIVESPLTITSRRNCVFLPKDNLGLLEWDDEANRELIEKSAERLFERYYQDFVNNRISAKRIAYYEAQLFDGDRLLAKENAKKNFDARNFSRAREIVFKRDGGVCQICLTKVLYEHYECGHMIDKMLGGSNLPTNLVCMCVTCNRNKDLTQTVNEYAEWAIRYRAEEKQRWDVWTLALNGLPIYTHK